MAISIHRAREFFYIVKNSQLGRKLDDDRQTFERCWTGDRWGTSLAMGKSFSTEEEAKKYFAAHPELKD